MKIWAFDPGAVATGFAWVSTDGPYWLADQANDLLDVNGEVWSYVHGPEDVYLIEMFRSAGYLNRFAQDTIEVIGALKFMVRSHWGKEPLIVAEQARLSGQREAAELMEDDLDVLREDPLRKDAFSALAHACAYRRKING